MKIKLMIVALIMGMVSCTERNVPSTKTEYMVNTYGLVEIVVIDSCEYLYGPWGNATILTHKGNCKNPIHKGGSNE
jgi:hypothetical protein